MTGNGTVARQNVSVSDPAPASIDVGTCEEGFLAVADNVTLCISARYLRDHNQVTLPQTTLNVIESESQDERVLRQDEFRRRDASDLAACAAPV